MCTPQCEMPLLVLALAAHKLKASFGLEITSYWEMQLKYVLPCEAFPSSLPNSKMNQCFLPDTLSPYKAFHDLQTSVHVYLSCLPLEISQTLCLALGMDVCQMTEGA